MGEFANLKITEQELLEHGMTSLSGTKWINQAELLKKKMDGDGTLVAGRMGQVLDLLNGLTAAANIGADVSSVATKTVQAILTAFEAAIAARYTSAQMDALVSTNTNNLVRDIVFDDSNGAFTITKKDGSVESIDTVLEKVPISMVFETVGDVTRIKLTNQDGTESYADVSSLVDNYTFYNTTTIAFSISGTGNQRTLTAEVRDASVTLAKLSVDAITALEGYRDAAGLSAQSASNSEIAAANSETNAANSETAAQTSATSAEAVETTSAASAASATASETNALASKNASAISATDSQSWAVGGTGTRAGEDTNNAEYWSRQAEAAAGGGVTTFNGRDGIVVPQSGDYTAAMTGAAEASHKHDDRYYTESEIDAMMSGLGGGASVTQFPVSITSAGWVGSVAPFTNTLSISGILETDSPHVSIVYSDVLDTALLEKAAYSCVDMVKATAADTIVFTCFEEKPTQNINVSMEVFRNG